MKKTPEIIDEIVARISQGETLRSICREKGKPSFVAVYDWLNRDDEFALRFARARETGHDVIAEQCLDIADSVINDTQRDKLRIETRLKLLAKWNPKKWGERLDLNHSGSVASKPTEQDIEMLESYAIAKSTKPE